MTLARNISTIAATITPTPITTRRTRTVTERNNKNKRVMETATTMIEMKEETIIIGTKIVSVNQVLITIRLNPVARIKQNAISDTVFNVQSPWHHCLQSTSPIIFSL